MAVEVTTGGTLNAYQGNANLASGINNPDYAKINLDPLQNYALKKYETNLVDYNQQQKDKELLQNNFTDPAIHLQLDKEYADQLAPQMDSFVKSAKSNLQLNPNSEEWYNALSAHKDLINNNAQLKAVQTLREKALADAASADNPQEAEKQNAYAEKLKKYKLGQQIPVYQKNFVYNDKYVPKGDEHKFSSERVSADGKTKNTYNNTIFNPINLPEKTRELGVTNPEAAKTWGDIAYTTLQSKDVPQLNEAMAKTYTNGMLLNNGQLQQQHLPEYKKYLVDHPGATFEDFGLANGLKPELDEIKKGHEYLKTPLQEIVVPENENLAGFSYYTDPQSGERKRLSVDDETLGAIFGATRNVPGKKEELVKSELSITPKDELDVNAKIKINNDDNAQRERESLREEKTKRYIAGLKDYADGTSKTVPELPMTPLPSILTGIGKYNKQVSVSSLPVSQIAAINPKWLDEKGNLDPNFSDIKISVGKLDEGGDGIFVFKKGKNKSKYDYVESFNESKLKSNAETWLATYAKERKGQEVYGYVQDLYDKAKGVKPIMKNNSDYYNSGSNIERQEGDTYIYKDGTSWEIKNNKLVQIK